MARQGRRDPSSPRSYDGTGSARTLADFWKGFSTDSGFRISMGGLVEVFLSGMGNGLSGLPGKTLTGEKGEEVFGETPNAATGTVALPIFPGGESAC
jgi:hypothetical protein